MAGMEPLEQVLAQNSQLIDALTRLVLSSSPVEVIRALNGPAVQVEPPTFEDPLEGDAGREGEAVDAWGDDQVAWEDLAGVSVPGPEVKEAEFEGGSGA